MEIGRAAYEAAVKEQAKQYPWLSDRAIARRLGIGHPTVGRYRRALGLKRLEVPRMGAINGAILVLGQAVRAKDYDLTTLVQEVPAGTRQARAQTVQQVMTMLQAYADALAPSYVPPSEGGRQQRWSPASDAGSDVNQDRRGRDGWYTRGSHEP